jgi:hypothetical protein
MESCSEILRGSFIFVYDNELSELSSLDNPVIRRGAHRPPPPPTKKKTNKTPQQQTRGSEASRTHGNA